MPASFRTPTARLRTALIALAGMASGAESQIAFIPGLETNYSEMVAPWRGPGFAQENPAVLGETRKAYGFLGDTRFVDAEDNYPLYQFAAGLPLGLAAHPDFPQWLWGDQIPGGAGFFWCLGLSVEL